jgi:hypothetical protein
MMKVEEQIGDEFLIGLDWTNGWTALEERDWIGR